jgi:hypothetical protein
VINRPEIYDGESLSSYLCRLAAANYKSVGVIIGRFGITRANWLKNTYTNDQLNEIAFHSNQDVSKLIQGTYQSFGVNKVFHHLRNRMKYCPECIRHSWIHRAVWGLKPVSVCLDHECILVDACPKCSKPIILDHFMEGFCNHCSNIFPTEATRLNIDSFQFEQQKVFQTALFRGTKVLPHLGGLDVNEYLELAHHSFHLIEGLTSFLDNQSSPIKAFTNQKGGYQSNQLLLEANANVYWIYLAFPSRFHLALTRFMQKSKRMIYLQKKVFEQLFENSTFKFVKEAYENFWFAELEKGSVRRDFSVFKKNGALLEQSRYLRKEEIKRSIGMSYPKIEALHEAGLLNIQSVNKFKIPQHFIDKETFQRFQNERMLLINKKEASAILGIDKSSITQLIKKGMLDDFQTPFSKHKLLLRKEVEQLLVQSRGCFCFNPQGIKFRDVFMKYSVNQLTMFKLLGFIHQGLLRPQLEVRNGTLADTWFIDDELRQCVEIIKKEKMSIEGMYKKDVMEYLGIGEKKINSWIDTGKLVPVKVVSLKDGRKRYLFNVQNVQKLLS